MSQYAIRRPKTDEDPAPTPTNPVPSTPQDSSNNNPTSQLTNRPTSQTDNQSNSPETLTTMQPASSPTDPPKSAISVSSDLAQPAAQLSDTISPPATPLESVERRRRSLENISKISQALEAYREKNGRYPVQATYSQSGQAILSWRVELLPYLGYQALYDRFNKSEPWNSVNNQPLLAQIPAVFQSPERYDDKTNYLVPVGSSCAFFGNRPKVPRRWDDGMTNVAVLLEVDEHLAVAWTKPDDFIVDLRDPKNGLGNLREDGFFMAWAGGQVARIATTSSKADVKAMFTVDGGEPFNSGAISLVASAEFEATSVAATTAPNQLQNHIAPNRPTFHTRATSKERATTAPNGSRDDLLNLTAFTFASKQESAAVQLTYIAFLADRLSAKDEYRWVSGLHRPAAFVRYGIAIDYSGSDHDQMSNLNDNEKGWQAKKSTFSKVAGELGDRLIDMLEQTKPVGPGSIVTHELDRRSLARANPASNVLSPGIECLGGGNLGTMFRVAHDRHVDVLVMFVVQDREGSRSNTTNKHVTLKCFDVVNRRSLYESPSISYQRRENKRTEDPLYKDPIEQTVLAVEALIANEFSSQPIPAGLRTKHAVARTKKLSKMASTNKLQAAAEIKLYHQMELLSMEQTLTAYSDLFGTETGLTLLAGDSSKRELSLNAFRPRIEFTDSTRQRLSDDNDD